MKVCNPNTSVILLGCSTEFRIKIEGLEELASLENEQISTKLGAQLAPNKNAINYLKWSVIDEINSQDINEKLVSTSICDRNLMPSFRIFFNGKTETWSS